MSILNLELGVFGGLITPVCSYILSEGFLCHSTENWGLTLPCVVLCCVVDLEPCLLSCPGSSVGRALCLESRVLWVRVPPRAALFSVLVGVALCTCLAPLDSCDDSAHGMIMCVWCVCTYACMCVSVCGMRYTNHSYPGSQWFLCDNKLLQRMYEPTVLVTENQLPPLPLISSIAHSSTIRDLPI